MDDHRDLKREHLRESFDQASAIYQRARPEYPDELFDHLVDKTGLVVGDRVLEIGCGPGKATVPLARRDLRVTCVELGPQLAAAARRNLSGFAHVEVVQSSFEEWARPENVTFDLVCAATAWHWIEPTSRYRKAWGALRPAGYLAFWSAAHVFPDDGDRFFVELQDVYQDIGESLPRNNLWARPGELEEHHDEIEGSGLFRVVDVRHFDWQAVYDADAYIDLLNTFSGHIAMEEAKRRHLYTEIRRRVAARPDGLVRRHWGAVLHIARRRE